MFEMNKSEKYLYKQFYVNVFLKNPKFNYIFISRHKDYLWIKNLNGLNLKQNFPFKLDISWELNLVNVNITKNNDEIMSKLILNDIKEADVIQIYKDIFDTIKNLSKNKNQSFDYTLADEALVPSSLKDEKYIKRGIFFFKRI